MRYPPNIHEVEPLRTEIVNLRADNERLRAALCDLSPQQAAVFCLRWLSELSYEEIASELELSVDAVGVTLHRARARLQELLAPATRRADELR